MKYQFTFPNIYFAIIYNSCRVASQTSLWRSLMTSMNQCHIVVCKSCSQNRPT